MPHSHFLILGLDGLRLDMVTPELTPNLLSLARHGVFFRQHHAVFPTATRVNVTSLVTGVNSGTHGIVNNSIFAPGVSPDKPVDLGKYDVVEAADAYYQGALLGAPSLGEVLATHGETMVAISSGTTGSNRLMHHRVKTLGGIGFSAQGLAPCYPTSEAEAILARFGPAPAAGTPDQGRLAYITDVFLDHIFPTYQPRVTILWFSDPDRTYHYCGIGSRESLEAIRAADAQLGRIMDWLQQPAQRARLNLLVLSDHGHITVRQQVSVREGLAGVGIAAGNGCFGDGNVAVVPGSAGSIHVRHHDAHLVQRIAAWLQEQPWCGALFTQGKNAVEGIAPGTLARSLVLNEHPRAGDIVYVMRTDEARDAHGIVGGCYDDSRLPLGGGTHGGLSQHELHNVCFAYGPAFQEGGESLVPSGTVDILPTLLHLLGYDIPPSIEGRVLFEALAHPAAAPELAVETRTYSAETLTPAGLYRQQLSVTRVGATVYLERGWVE
ncbi:MAG TPA: alkaline phosphatase family protein [Candidatus Tectomicrobia bacterium]|jgi:arylsulfatase A-like enzyme